MFKNYFKTAWRNIWKNKFFSLINILGLGLAIPFSLLSLIQVQSAYEADNFHPYPDRTYRINTDIKDNGGSITKYALSPQTTAEGLEKNYPDVQIATFTIRDYGWELSDRLKTLPVNTLFVEPNFFDMFGFRFLSGSRPVAPNSIAITKEKAIAFFGTDDVVGKVLTHLTYGDLVITGVLEPFERNTVFKTDVMVSMDTWKKFNKDTIPTSLFGLTYVLVRPNTTPGQLDAALAGVASGINKNAAAKNVKESVTFHKQKIEDLSPDFESLEGNFNVDSISDLSFNFSLALALLILAAFNYINLALARSINRAKEVGLRKTIGASRSQIIVQFIFEAVLITLLSLVVGYVVLQLIYHFSYVNWFAWKVDNQWVLWATFILFTILVGVLSGFVPARILSRFTPVKVLKGNIAPSAFGKTGLRNTLVIIQFVVSACFIFVMFTMLNQFRYMATDNSNFNRKNIYNIAASGKLRLLQHDILENKNVKRVGFVSAPFGGNAAQASVKKDKRSTNASANYYAADAGFVSNMHLQVVAGSNLLPSVSDSASNFVLVNEQLLSALGLGKAREAIGKTFLLNDEHEVIIHGVLPDFCYNNYQFAAEPLILQYNPSQFHVLNIETTGKMDDDIFKSEMNSVWKKYFLYDEMSFSNYSRDLYESYFPAGNLKFMGLFCIVMLIIALMGLLGIVTYQIERKIKEIGIRKTLGASVRQITKELSKGFIKLAVIAALISLPLGYAVCYYFMDLFAYNNGVNLALLSILFCGIFLPALLIILYQSIKAATANPVKSLRTE
jgi:putative ABC transport system permease protein